MKHPVILGTSGSSQMHSPCWFASLGVLRWSWAMKRWTVPLLEQCCDILWPVASTGSGPENWNQLENNPISTHIPVTSVLARLKCEVATHFPVEKNNCFYKSLSSHWLMVDIAQVTTATAWCKPSSSMQGPVRCFVTPLLPESPPKIGRPRQALRTGCMWKQGVLLMLVKTAREFGRGHVAWFPVVSSCLIHTPLRCWFFGTRGGREMKGSRSATLEGLYVVQQVHSRFRHPGSGWWCGGRFGRLHCSHLHEGHPSGAGGACQEVGKNHSEL